MSEIRFLPVTIKAASSEPAGLIAGYASTFDGPPDAVGDIVAPGAYQASLESHKADNTQPAMLWGHNQSDPCGRWLELNEDSHGLHVKGRLTLDSDRGRNAFALAKDGALSFSVGVNVLDFEQTENARVLKSLHLAEISLVALPANPRARVTDVKSLTVRDFEHLARDVLGLSAKEAKRLASAGWRGLKGSDDTQDLLAAIEKHTQTLKQFLR